MASFTLTARHQQKTDTSANWTSTNPVLLVGEIGIESNTGKLKVGNGINTWSQLGYIGITTEYLSANYLPKNNPTVSGAIQMTDSNSKITRSTVSPAGNNIGVNGVMITHFSGDEGGLLINEDGAYLWNSSDSGSLLKILDEDVWTSNTEMKKDCNFTNGLMFNFDSMGNLKIKGKLYQDSGVNTLISGLNTGSVTPQNIWVGTQSAYDALTKSTNTVYIII